MKVIILAGGFGTRMSEFTELIPKPMVQIGDKPMLMHIMETYSHFGHKDFYLALGYKSEIIKKYFLDYRSINSNFTIDLESGSISPHKINKLDWKVSLIDTGTNSLTGGRIKRLQNFIGNESCMLTYGDGLSNINIDKLLAFHRSHKKLVTVTAVRPTARFGQLDLNLDRVISFKEKPHLDQGWINGGYFVVEPEFFNYIDSDLTQLEKEPLEKMAEMGELMAYKHEDFWQCIDTKRDFDYLQSLWSTEQSPWKVF